MSILSSHERSDFHLFCGDTSRVYINLLNTKVDNRWRCVGRALTAFLLSASETAEFERCRNRSITFVIGERVASERRTAVTV